MILSYIVSLEKKIKNQRVRDFLFNKYYSIVDIYWNFYYVFWYGVISGIGNAFPSFGEPDMIRLFIQGFVNNAMLGLILNLFYARTVNYLITTRFPRLYPNILNLAVQALFLFWHFFIGTENPLQTWTLPFIAGFILTNYHVIRATSNKKE